MDERGGQARRADIQGRRCLQGDGVRPQRQDPPAEAADLPAGRGRRQPVHQHGLPHRRVLQRGDGRADLLPER